MVVDFTSIRLPIPVCPRCGSTDLRTYRSTFLGDRDDMAPGDPEELERHIYCRGCLLRFRMTFTSDYSAVSLPCPNFYHSGENSTTWKRPFGKLR